MCVCVRLREGGQRGRAGMQEECLRPHHSPAGRSASPSEAPSPRGAARPVALMASSADGANQISRPAHSEKKMAQYFPFFEKTKNRLVASGGKYPKVSRTPTPSSCPIFQRRRTSCSRGLPELPCDGFSSPFPGQKKPTSDACGLSHSREAYVRRKLQS